MAFQTHSPEYLIQQLSWRSSYVQRTMIEIRLNSVPTFISNTTDRPSSAGSIDRLPLEVLHIALNYLDFRTLYNLARVTLRGRAIVESLPAYKDMIKHACGALAALNRTKLISTHSAALVHSALRSETCTACDRYGPFLYLPTCERCCLGCLADDPLLRVMTLHMASVCFGVTQKELHRVPVIHGIPGTYRAVDEVTQIKRLKLVSAKQAKELGVAVHGSEDALEQFIASRDAPRLLAYNQPVASQSLSLSSHQRPRNQTPASRFLSYPKDRYCGMASTPIASLKPQAERQDGLWCLGCHKRVERYDKYGILEGDKPSELGSTPRGKLLREAWRAWSRSDFLSHVKECKGALEILKNTNAGQAK